MAKKIKEKEYAFEGREIVVDLLGKPFSVVLTKEKYADGNIAIVGHDPDDEPFGTLSVNLPEDANILNNNEVFIKNWSENEAFAKAALKSGFFIDTCKIFIDTCKSINTGFVLAPIWEMVTEEQYQSLLKLKTSKKRCYSDWVCSECDMEVRVEKITFDDLAVSGGPICKECGEDMVIDKEYFE
jgi:hypothetical protein